MLKSFKTALAALLLALVAQTAALAQSSPGLITKQVPTAAQWNSYFAAKQDNLGFTPMNVLGGTFSGRVVTAPPGASTAGLNLTCGSTPGSPVNGDLWCTSSGAFIQINGLTVGPIAGAGSLNSQTANYTIANTDCGKTIQAGTGSTGQFTITLPAIAGFSLPCAVIVKNGDTARGKELSGFPADLWHTLYPSQSVTVAIVNGVWATISNPGPWVPQAALTLQVNHSTGSDTTSDCLAFSTGACATIQHAFDILKTQIRPPLAIVANGFPQIQSDCGFTENPVLTGSGASETGLITINGNGGSPSSCVWTSAGMSIDKGAIIGLEGFTFRLSGTNSIVTVSKMGILAEWNNIWGTATGGTHILISDNGVVSTDPGTHQVGEAACAPNCMLTHVFNNGGVYKQGGAQTVSVPSALTFTQWYQGANANSSMRFDSTMSFTGTGAAGGSTGLKSALSNGATMSIGATVLPGASAGTNSGNIGTVTSDNACAGCVGEYVAATNPAVNAATVTMTIASPAVITWSGNPYSGAGNWTAPIVFTTTGTLPTNIVSGTTYWLIGTSLSGNTFNVATSIANALAGTAINTTGSQSGTHTGTSGIVMGNNSAQTCAAISLTAGDWEVSGVGYRAFGNTTNTTLAETSISQTTNARDTTTGNYMQLAYGSGGIVVGNTGQISESIPPLRKSLSATTTVYIVAFDLFTLSTNTAYCNMKARRAH